MSVLNPLIIVAVALIFTQLWVLINQARTRRIAESTHSIVNSQRSAMLRLIAELTDRIATENPRDKKARSAATVAQREADDADNPRR